MFYRDHSARWFVCACCIVALAAAISAVAARAARANPGAHPGASIDESAELPVDPWKEHIDKDGVDEAPICQNQFADIAATRWWPRCDTV